MSGINAHLILLRDDTADMAEKLEKTTTPVWQRTACWPMLPQLEVAESVNVAKGQLTVQCNLQAARLACLRDCKVSCRVLMLDGMHPEIRMSWYAVCSISSHILHTFTKIYNPHL